MTKKGDFSTKTVKKGVFSAENLQKGEKRLLSFETNEKTTIRIDRLVSEGAWRLGGEAKS